MKGVFTNADMRQKRVKKALEVVLLMVVGRVVWNAVPMAQPLLSWNACAVCGKEQILGLSQPALSCPLPPSPPCLTHHTQRLLVPAEEGTRQLLPCTVYDLRCALREGGACRQLQHPRAAQLERLQAQRRRQLKRGDANWGYECASRLSRKSSMGKMPAHCSAVDFW